MITVCPLTGKSLGRKAVNGVFKFNWAHTRQISLVYKHPINSQDLEAGFYTQTTCIHTPVHIDVVTMTLSPEDLKKIESNLENDKNVRDFKRDFPHAKLASWVEYKLPFLIKG